MIYALVEEDTPCPTRRMVAQAILDNNSTLIGCFVRKGTIVHIMDVQDRHCLFCIHCCNPLFPSNRRPPNAARPWHFEHRQTGHSPGECVGHVRRPPTPHALGICNPRGHGCYIMLDRETDGNESPTDQHRTMCKVIDNGHTFCHQAGQQIPPCIPASP